MKCSECHGCVRTITEMPFHFRYQCFLKMMLSGQYWHSTSRPPMLPPKVMSK